MFNSDLFIVNCHFLLYEVLLAKFSLDNKLFLGGIQFRSEMTFDRGLIEVTLEKQNKEGAARLVS